MNTPELWFYGSLVLACMLAGDIALLTWFYDRMTRNARWWSLAAMPALGLLSGFCLLAGLLVWVF